MMRRFLLASAALALLIGAPVSSAQSVMEISAEWEQESLELPESGRGDMPLILKARISNTNCAQEQSYIVEVKLASFAKWGGASLLPPTATFKVPAGPVAGEQELPDQEIELNIAWDLEQAPRTDAVQQYVALIRPDDVTKTGGPCVPDAKIETTDSEPLRVTLPDRSFPDADLSCLDDPNQPKCITTSAPPGPTPGIGPFALLTLIAMVALVRRRRRSG